MLTGDDIRELFERSMGQNGVRFMQAFAPTLRELNRADLPAPGQSAAIAFHNPRTSSLIFDRIWGGLHAEIPNEIRFRGLSVAETGLLFLTQMLFAMEGAAKKDPIFQQLVQQVATALIGTLPEGMLGPTPAIDQYSRVIAASLGAEYGIPVVAIFKSAEQRDREYHEGDRAAVVAILENVPIIDESQLEWSQVLEIRRDQAVRQKLQRFIHWLDRDMIGRSDDFICQDIALRLSDFEAAAKKHGIATTAGILQVILDASVVFAGSSAIAKLSAAPDPKWALGAGIALVVAKAAVQIVRTSLELGRQKSTATGEISYVIEVQRRVRDAG